MIRNVLAFHVPPPQPPGDARTGAGFGDKNRVSTTFPLELLQNSPILCIFRALLVPLGILRVILGVNFAQVTPKHPVVRHQSGR